jgi:DNA-binding NarL/FixJ family response regulator
VEAAMAALDFNQFSHLHKFFPELTELQSGYACLLAFGSYSVSRIAEIRGVSTATVKESVFSIQKKLCVSDMQTLRTV